MMGTAKNTTVAETGESDDEIIEDSASETPSDPAAGDGSQDEKPKDEDATVARRRRWVRSAFRWIAAVTFVAVLTGAGYEGWLLYVQHHKDVAAAQALDAANKFAVTLTTTDPNAVDQNFTDILGGATGEFKDIYTKASSSLRKMLIDNKVATQGTVVDSAIKSATTTEVEVLLFVKQSVTNSASPDSRSEVTAIMMTMENVGGRWLASKVVLPSEQG